MRQDDRESRREEEHRSHLGVGEVDGQAERFAHDIRAVHVILPMQNKRQQGPRPVLPSFPFPPRALSSLCKDSYPAAVMTSIADSKQGMDQWHLERDNEGLAGAFVLAHAVLLLCVQAHPPQRPATLLHHRLAVPDATSVPAISQQAGKLTGLVGSSCISLSRTELSFCVPFGVCGILNGTCAFILCGPPPRS